MSGKAKRNRNRKVEIKPSIAEAMAKALGSGLIGFEDILNRDHYDPKIYVSPERFRKMLEVYGDAGRYQVPQEKSNVALCYKTEEIQD